MSGPLISREIRGFVFAQGKLFVVITALRLEPAVVGNTYCKRYLVGDKFFQYMLDEAVFIFYADRDSVCRRKNMRHADG